MSTARGRKRQLQLRKSRVGLSVAALAMSATLIACLDTAAPTPASTLVSVSPARSWVRANETQAGIRFVIDLEIRNTGSTRIYLDRGYGRTEKLIDQKWKVVLERSATPFTTVRSIEAGQLTVVSYVVEYVRGVSPESVYLARARGLYRAGLRFAFAADGTTPLPAEESYSKPFVVE